MKVLVLGASGATGKLAVDQLLKAGLLVKIIIRSSSNIPLEWKTVKNLEITYGYIASMPIIELMVILQDCNSVISFLGHNLSWKGIYGKPRKLVTEVLINVCKAIEELRSDKLFKIVLMNTAGNQNRDIPESITLKEKLVLGIIRLILPPHSDNEAASDYLRVKIGRSNDKIEWVIVRPDTLIDGNIVTDYTCHPSPNRSALFNPGKTSRINVANFMVKLTQDSDLWVKWKGKMPVIYNTELTNLN